MKICVITDCYLPRTKSGAKLVHDLAVEFLRTGHEPLVVAPDDTLATPSQVSVEAGVTVFRVRTGKTKGAGLIRRGWNEARLSSTIWRAGREFFKARGCDLVVFYSPSIFFGALVEKLKRLWHCPAYLILRDIFPQWAVDAGVLRKGPPYWYFRHVEKRQYRAADVIGVQSPANLDYFAGTARRFEVLYNWTRLDDPPPARIDYRKEWGLEGKVVFFFGGTAGVAQDMDNLVRLAKAMKNEPQAAFLVVGEGSEMPRLRRIVSERSLGNFHIKDAVGQEEYASMVGLFDVGLISLHRDLRTQNFPGKLLSYMLAGLPTLASVNPGNDVLRFVEQEGAGLVSVNGEDAAFLANALRLARDPELRRELGRNARSLLEQRFSVASAAAQILRAIPR